MTRSLLFAAAVALTGGLLGLILMYAWVQLADGRGSPFS